ncbi:MAG: TolC family protein [Planctomycetes bacterium]|nr:TolC family protein [Planctomycetota bacterium]
MKRRDRCSLLKGLFAGVCCTAAATLTGCVGQQLTASRAQRVVVELPSQTRLQRLPQLSRTRDSTPVRLVALQEASETEQLLPAADPTITGSSGGLRPRSVAEALGQGGSEELGFAGVPTMQLDLTSTLALVSGQNPMIVHAAARYEEAYARLAGAKVLWVPSIRAGVSYHHHDGNLQTSGGGIVDVDRSSMQGGLGVGAVGAGTTPVPGVVARFHATDALFQPRINEHATSARSHAVDAAVNDALLEGALAYLELLRAEQLRAVANETLANATQLAELTMSFADSGQGPQADADRAKTEAAIRKNDTSRAEEAVEVANARLVEALSAEPTTRVLTTEPVVVPLHLVEPGMAPGELLALGLANRPELGEARHLVSEAVSRYERERFAPLLPSVLLGMSETSFGGGLGGNLGNSEHRFDFDAVAFWELRNFGFGERAARDERRSVYEQRQLEEVRLMDRVAREINVAHAQVLSRQGQIDVAESAVKSATESYDRNSTRIKEGVGLPIETLQAIQALDQARREYVRTVVDYNAAQFRLHRALGWAIQ